MNENKGKEILNNNATNTSKPVKDNRDMKKKLMRIMLIVVGVLVLLLVVILIISLFSNGNKTYEEIEEDLKNAAMEYYEVQSGLLPREEGETVTVRASALIDAGYMKPLSELREGENCSGRVEVTKIEDNMVYTPYLDCGDNYTTKELYKAVLEQGIVTSGNGLYDMNGEKVYRGDNVNNYVQLDNQMFRIVKVTSDNKILLILNEMDSTLSTYYDDRYNPDRMFNSGFNDYRISRIYEYLDRLYNNKLSVTILSSNDKTKLTPFNLCIGKRASTDTTNNNSLECSDVLENQMIGLLTASDFMNASLDANCRATTNKSCQNYNYLRLRETEWWLVTSNSLNNYEAYVVKSAGYIDENQASGYKKIRPTVMLNNNVMIKSGDGSASNPFVLK
ncbi:MAG TPA: hypothetical protein IAB59_04200 [Candidatus Onthousia faecipullorum]|uniref:Uncharacterized protein n=1 Tax=Candidatus Onthousia faecipullorum TaxID=2840887 RepID=A0A9D1KAV3_9FIRM|nr:hypothetical protein [Candidatus Onthousia faecipullorum]